MKRALPAVMLSGSTRGGHKGSDVLEHSGLLQIDLDHVGNAAALRDRIGKDQHILAAWISPSGDGVKAIMRIPPDIQRHKVAFEAAMEYMRETYDEAIDEKCSDSSRLCFVCYDPALVSNPDAVSLEVPVVRAEAPPQMPPLVDSLMNETDHAVLERAEAYLDKMPVSVSGNGGDDALFDAATALVRGFNLNVQAALPLLAKWNLGCRPPWNESRLLYKLDSAAKSSTKPPGYLLIERPNTETAPVIRPLWQYSKNDLGNAEALADFIHGRAVYCPQLHKWLTFGLRWQRDGSKQIHTMTSSLSRHALREASAVQEDNARAEAVKRALCLGNRKTMENAIALAETNPKVIVHLSQLDTDPWLIGVENGTLNLQTGQLVQTSIEAYVTRGVGTAFDPHAICPIWEGFIKRVTRGHDGLAEFIQRSVGYSLTGQTVEHVFWFLHGAGRNGKSTFIETLQNLSGEYGARSSEKLLAMSKHGADTPQDEVAGLHGCRFLFGSETQEGVRLNEKFIKDLTGGDTVHGRQLYKEGVQFRPTCKLWMFGNHRPDICGTDHGIWRRVQLVPFTATITAEEIDKDLPAKLCTELPGILNWAIAGLRQWETAGLAAPRCVTSATAEYQSDQDILGDFINDNVNSVPGATTTKPAMYKSYQRWAIEKGHRYPLTDKKLSHRLKDRGFVELPSRLWADCRLVSVG
ncbi:phage/plasmid primase, P4 family [Prosthecobacter sp.]|uniref:phage/plasmid primase, P4 family n=1 Tax=Prosthecobacter sp. TaxID=1965333 RepID=UPI0025D92B43|nr:phage/plasmid primase, P4 family [Prosthecobacter sp.]